MIKLLRLWKKRKKSASSSIVPPTCPNYRECYAEMPEMYEHMLQQDMKAMYQDYLEKGVTNR